jgi:hypothetical protein
MIFDNDIYNDKYAFLEDTEENEDENYQEKW